MADIIALDTEYPASPQQIVLRLCTKCNQELPIERFCRHKNGPGGLNWTCKACKSLAAKHYRAENEGAIKSAKKDYRDANPDKIRRQKAASRAKHAETIKAKKRAYFRENREAITARKQVRRTDADRVAKKEYNLTYRSTNLERIKAKGAIRRESQRDKLRAQAREYYHATKSDRALKRKEQTKRSRQKARKERPEQIREYKNRRRARKSEGGHHTAEDIVTLFLLQSAKCAHLWCRKSLKLGYEVDHVMPLAKGGSNAKTNIQLLCMPCNRSKGARHPVDHAQLNGMLL